MPADTTSADTQGVPLLQISSLAVAIGSATPVQEVTLHLNKGQLICLVGASGSGKTLTALATIGLLPPEARIIAGSIRLGNDELAGLQEKQWREIRGRRVAMIFQEPMTSLNPVMTIGAQLMEAIRRHTTMTKKEARTRAEQLLREVSVPDPDGRLNAWPHQLSGGLRQRVMIAMALSCNPQLLIADEPTTALDVTVQAGVLALLRRICADRRLGILFITHDIALASEYSDGIIVMDKGKTIEAGQTSRLINHPHHPVTRTLLKAARARQSWHQSA